MPTHHQGSAHDRAAYRSTRALPHQRMQVMERLPGCSADDTEYIGSPPAAYGNAAAAGAQPQNAAGGISGTAGAPFQDGPAPERQAEKAA